MKSQFLKTNSTILLPKEIRISLLILDTLWVFGGGCFLLVVFTILIGYNITNSTTLIILLSLLVLFSTYFILAREIKKKKDSAFLFLSVSGIINLIVVSIGLSIIPLEVKYNFEFLLIITGLIIVSTISLLPFFAAIMSFSKRDFFTKKTSISSSIFLASIAIIVGVINTFWLGFFSYLLLVLLFPSTYALNT